MNALDLTPFRQSSVGFDRMLDLIDDAFRFEVGDHPSYDIVHTGENSYRILMAVPGFKPDQIEIVAQQNSLTVTGKGAEGSDQDYVFRGIPRGPFERRFNLADYVEVKEAAFQDGILRIDLVREVPEAMKPRKIEIRTASNPNQTVTKLDQRRAS